VCGTHEGEVNYPDWLAFFTTNPICTTTDIGQFIRFGGGSSTGARAGELRSDRYTVSGQGMEGLPMVIGAPGVDREAYPTSVQVGVHLNPSPAREIWREREREREREGIVHSLSHLLTGLALHVCVCVGFGHPRAGDR